MKPLFNPKRMKNLDATQVGAIGENLVASILAGYGYEVVRTNGKGYDLIVMPPSSHRANAYYPILVDVKTKASADGQRIFNIKKGKKTNYRDYDSSDCDLFALVCLEDMSVVFRKCDEFEGKRSIYLNSEEHKQIDPYVSWREAVGMG